MSSIADNPACLNGEPPDLPILSLLGRFEVRRGGRVLPVVRRKVSVLVAWLAMSPARQARSRIAEALWPDADPSDGRRSLRVLLTEVRRLLGVALLDDERDTLALDPRACRVDLWEVEQALRQADKVPLAALHEAIQRASAELLPQADEAWLSEARTHLATLRRHARLQRVERLIREADAESARAAAEELLVEDPTDEAACRILAACLQALRQPALALGRLEAFCRLLRAHERTPEPATQALLQRLTVAVANARLPPPGWLPGHVSSFVGREFELNEIETLLRQHRLVTLVGPGGAGKSRLALQAAHEVAHDHEGGAWWIDLSPVAMPTLVAHAVATRLGVVQSSAPLLDDIAAHLGKRHALLVLDTCEHVLDSVAHVVETLLLACSGLRVLATSRQPLPLTSQATWHTPGLSLPQPDCTDWTLLAENDAVLLLRDRARAAGAGALEDETSLRTMAALCLEVQGMPLALELVAARCGQGRIEDVLGGLHGRLRDASPGSDDDGSSHPTHVLRGTLVWTWQGLPDTEQVLLRRLSAFAGGCTLEAAMLVASGMSGGQPLLGGPGNQRAHLLTAMPVDASWVVRQALESLARRALLRVTHSEGQARFHMLDSVRGFASEHSANSGEHEALQLAHLSHFEALSTRCCAALNEQAHDLAKRELEAETDNLHAALGFAARLPDKARLLALANTLCRWWIPYCHYGTAQHWLELAMDAATVAETVREIAPDPARLQLHTNLADVHYRRGRASSALVHAQAALEGYEALGDREAQSRAWYALATAHWMVPNPDLALQASWRSLALARETEDQRAILYALNSLGEIDRVMRRGDAAVAAFGECIQLASQRGDRRLEAISTLNLGLSQLVQGLPRAAVLTLQQAVRMAVDIRVNHIVSYALLGVGQACLLARQRGPALAWLVRLQAFASATDCAPLGPDAEAMQAALECAQRGLRPQALGAIRQQYATGPLSLFIDELLAFDALALPERVPPDQDCPFLASALQPVGSHGTHLRGTKPSTL